MKISDFLSREEIAYFSRKSDFHAWRLLLANWLAIIAIFVVVAQYPNPLTIAIALLLIAGRQLGLSVLMHECGHRCLFKTSRLNDFMGQWFCALPVMNDLPSYARGHLGHHRHAGTREDPDLGNYQAYPISRASFKRKVIRDLTGQTGIKMLARIARGAGNAMSREKRKSAKPFLQALAVQAIMALVLAAMGYAWLYLVWIGAYLTTFMLIIRLRQVAEHAAVPDLYDLDPRKNTRTTIARWWERLILAPNGVNYHMEHHFMASVPCYKLKEMHQHLLDKQVLADTPECIGYAAVLRQAVVA
ncbi:MAG: fatty acid desaturase family protein [Halieaceae bacterium]|jgi:fatty acid desaturase|nr:fatty acid desaturase family protein [Halieaceae bacterium]